MIIKDRPYQSKCKENVRSNIKNGIRSQIILAPTGAGKTIIACGIMQSAVEKKNKCLFLAHRKELIDQCSKKLDQFELGHGVIKSGHYRVRPNESIQVAGVQTLVNRPKPDADIVIIDEAHLSIANTYHNILENYPKAIVLGLTATPQRLDGKGLDSIYDAIVPTLSIASLIDMNYLVKPRLFTNDPGYDVDLDSIASTGGDYNKKALQKAVDKPKIVGDIVQHYGDIAINRKAIFFGAGINHSMHVCDEMNKQRIKAVHIDGKMSASERESKLNQWIEGKYDVFCNVGIAIEGLDVPATSAIILGAPSRSLTRYMQSVGRGLRTHEESDKEDCVVIDHARMIESHGPVQMDREWSLQGRKRKTKKAEAVLTMNAVNCLNCFAVFERKQGLINCPECGQPLPVKNNKLKVSDEKLTEMTDEQIAAFKLNNKKEVSNAKTLDELILIGMSRGYKKPIGWAGHIIRNRQLR